jgi:Flp pilus assembly protein TadD
MVASRRRVLAVLALLAVATAGALRLSSRGGDPPRRVVVVGLDGADWQLLDDYCARGVMPQLARLVREGRSGALHTLVPPLSPLIWTTMVTGRSPLEHRILDFTRFHPVTGQREPITSDERRVKAVWEMAGESGRDVAVLGLWATHPAEPVRGLMISDRLFSFQRQEKDAPSAAVHPASEEERVRAARAAAESEVGLPALQPYVPWLAQSEYEELVARPDPYAHPVTALRRILVETRLYHGLATDWLQREKPALSIVYIQGTDSIGHVFAPYAPPRQPAISEADFERYSRVPEAFFREIDVLLGDYRAIAEASGAVLLLVSDHGFLWREGRPARPDSMAKATAGLWHRDEGIYLVWGRGIEPSATRGKGRVSQVAATILALLGLPRGAGLDEPALGGVPEQTEARSYGPRTISIQASADPAAQEAIEKLQALGYVGAGESATRPAATGTGTRTAGSFNNEGLLLRGAGRPADARAAFEQALNVDPRGASAKHNLSELLLEAGPGESARADELLLSALADGLGDGPRIAVATAFSHGRSGDAARARRLLDGAVLRLPTDPLLRLNRGRLRLESRDCAGAREDFAVFREKSPGLAVAHGLEGTALLCLGRVKEARAAFARSLAIDPAQDQLRQQLATLP